MSRIEGFGPLQADRSRREDVAWHFAQATLALATLDVDVADQVAPWIAAQIDDGPPDNADVVMWAIHHAFGARGYSRSDISQLRSQARQLAKQHDFPSLRAIAHMVVDGGETSWPELIGDRTGDRADSDPIEELRHASELARSVGAVTIDQEIANFITAAMLDRGITSDAAWLRSSLDSKHQHRSIGLMLVMVGILPTWFARIGEPNIAAIVVGYADQHPESFLYVRADRAADARTLIEDLPERAALERTGAAVDLDELVDYLLDEFDRIAAATTPTGEQPLCSS